MIVTVWWFMSDFGFGLFSWVVMLLFKGAVLIVALFGCDCWFGCLLFASDLVCVGCLGCLVWLYFNSVCTFILLLRGVCLYLCLGFGSCFGFSCVLVVVLGFGYCV